MLPKKKSRKWSDEILKVILEKRLENLIYNFIVGNPNTYLSSISLSKQTFKPTVELIIHIDKLSTPGGSKMGSGLILAIHLQPK